MVFNFLFFLDFSLSVCACRGEGVCMCVFSLVFLSSFCLFSVVGGWEVVQSVTVDLLSGCDVYFIAISITTLDA